MKITFKGSPVTLSGMEHQVGDNAPGHWSKHIIKVGDSAPEVWLKKNDLGAYKVGGKKDNIQIINVVPSIDTSVCATQTRIFNEKASALPGVEINVVSMDLPFAFNRFCSAEGIKNLTTLSDFNHKEFGNKYGLLIVDSPLEGLLTRAVIVVDKNGKVVYVEICEEISHQPNYQAALDALNAIK